MTSYLPDIGEGFNRYKIKSVDGVQERQPNENVLVLFDENDMNKEDPKKPEIKKEISMCLMTECPHDFREEDLDFNCPDCSENNALYSKPDTAWKNRLKAFLIGLEMENIDMMLTDEHEPLWWNRKGQSIASKIKELLDYKK